MEINSVEKVIYEKVLICAGDTLGQHYWGVYKEVVGVAFQKSRNGYVDISSFPRGSQCILGSLGGKQSFFRSRLL